MEAHRNNVGFLRLILAILVIVGHASEQIDGNRVREPFTVIFHTVSLPGVAVNAFFLLSGYLITMSAARSRSLISYLIRRALRIGPAFILAFLLCVLVMAPLVGGDLRRALPRTLLRLVFLQDPPHYPGQLAGLHYPALNGSMWTIAYEFRCYLLVALFGAFKILERRWIILGLTVLFLLGTVAETYTSVRGWSDAIDARLHAEIVLGSLVQSIALTSSFLAGACFYLFRSEITDRLTWKASLVCVTVAIALMFLPHFAEAGLATWGAAALFWLALKADLGRFQRINDSWDISYGVYLYGWPIATLLLWYNRNLSPWALAAATLPLALACGSASWWGLERWTKDFGRRGRVPKPLTAA